MSEIYLITGKNTHKACKFGRITQALELLKNWSDANVPELKLSVLINDEVDRVHIFYPNADNESKKYFLCNGNKWEESQHFSDLYEKLVNGESEPEKVYRYRVAGGKDLTCTVNHLESALKEIWSRNNNSYKDIELHLLSGDEVVAKYNFNSSAKKGIFWFETGDCNILGCGGMNSDLEKQYKSFIAKLEQEEDVEVYQTYSKGYHPMEWNTLGGALENIFYKANASHTDIKLSILKNGVVDRWFKFENGEFIGDGKGCVSETVKEAQELDRMYAEIVRDAEGEKFKPSSHMHFDVGIDMSMTGASEALTNALRNGNWNINQTNNKQESNMDRTLKVSTTDTALNVASRDIANRKIGQVNDVMSITESKVVKNLKYNLSLTLSETHEEFNKDGEGPLPYEAKSVELKIDLSQGAVKNIASEVYMLLQGFINETTTAVNNAETAGKKKF